MIREVAAALLKGVSVPVLSMLHAVYVLCGAEPAPSAPSAEKRHISAATGCVLAVVVSWMSVLCHGCCASGNPVIAKVVPVIPLQRLAPCIQGVVVPVMAHAILFAAWPMMTDTIP
jgi:hypothetical protein